MADTPLRVAAGSRVITGTLRGTVRDVGTIGTQEETVAMTSVTDGVYEGTITGTLTGDKFISWFDDGGNIEPDEIADVWIHGLKDNTETHYATSLPPVPHFSDVRRVQGQTATLTDLPVVYPAISATANRTLNGTLRLNVGATTPVSITILDSFGNPIDVDSETLVWVVETRGNTADVAVVEDADIVVSGVSNNIITLTVPAAVTSSPRSLRWALRQAGGNRTVFGTGSIFVSSAPIDD